MLVVYHRSGEAVSTGNIISGVTTEIQPGAVLGQLFKLAAENPECYLIWCDVRYREALNTAALGTIFEHKMMIASFAPEGCDYLPDAIGYVDHTNFINVEKTVRYATWRMSGLVGGIHASVLQFWKDRALETDFEYFLNSVARSSLLKGLRCYSEPRLLLPAAAVSACECCSRTLFKFVRQHYRRRWTAILLICLVVYERRFPLWSFLSAQFYKKIQELPASCFTEKPLPVHDFSQIKIDVVIPTIGRKQFLYDTLNDLRMQTLPPARVIVVEQNPQPGGKSELNYLTENSWPFEIIHHFTNQPGACNARNIALREIESDWVFLADDDIRLQPEFLERAFEQIKMHRANVFSFCCLTQDEKRLDDVAHQTTVFGSGCSILSRESLGGTRFNPAFEFGFGEDFDFGAQLAKRGYDTHYLPEPIIFHLKAPTGGFRTKNKFAWSDDEVQPKPSPTVLLSKLLHFSTEQINGYRLTLFLNNFRNSESNNPLRYFKNSKLRWDRSLYWAHKLRDRTRSDY